MPVSVPQKKGKPDIVVKHDEEFTRCSVHVRAYVNFCMRNSDKGHFEKGHITNDPHKGVFYCTNSGLSYCGKTVLTSEERKSTLQWTTCLVLMCPRVHCVSLFTEWTLTPF